MWEQMMWEQMIMGTNEAFRPTKNVTYQTASNLLHINYALRQYRDY